MSVLRLVRSHDDGGLVDVSHVGAEVLVRYLDLSPAQAEAIIAAREKLDRLRRPGKRL